jgi:hypothetical protein
MGPMSISATKHGVLEVEREGNAEKLIYRTEG